MFIEKISILDNDLTYAYVSNICTQNAITSSFERNALLF